MADAIPTMTSNSAPSGTASASTELSSGGVTYSAFKAMDDDNATWWSTTAAGVTPSWLMYQWVADNRKLVTSYTIRARSGAGNQDGAPKTFKLQGYIWPTYTDLDSPADQTGWGDGEQRTFVFSNTTAYQAYRLYVTANNGGTYTEIAEWELLFGPPKCRIELGGLKITCKQPLARIELGGLKITCKQPLARIELGGVRVMWCVPPPSKAINPNPADGAIKVSRGVDLSWEDGGGAETYDVYWGESPETLALVSDDQAGTTYDPGTLEEETTYYWRIDSTNETGTTEGDVWSFTTAAAVGNMLLGFTI